jgi:hypothetical protein
MLQLHFICSDKMLPFLSTRDRWVVLLPSSRSFLVNPLSQCYAFYFLTSFLPFFVIALYSFQLPMGHVGRAHRG